MRQDFYTVGPTDLRTVHDSTQQISGVEKSGVRQKCERVRFLEFVCFFFVFFNSDYSLCYGTLPGCVVFWSSFIGVQEHFNATSGVKC